MGFPFLTIFIVLVLFLAVRYRTISRKQDEDLSSFWARESAANATLPADLDKLPYLTIPLHNFPLGYSDDPSVIALEKELEELSKKRLLNLTGKTNTELKETYGVTNLATMQAIGEDFDRMTIVLKEYADTLIAANRLTDAVRVLEYGVAVGTDVSQNYILLGDCYHALGQDTKITYLMDQVTARNLVLGPKILRHLRTLLEPSVSGEDDNAVKKPEDFEA